MVVALKACLWGSKHAVFEHTGDSMGPKLAHSLSSAHPSGHRKGLRVVQLAERLNLPIVNLVDTPSPLPHEL